MTKEKKSIDSNQIKIFEKLLDSITKAGLLNLKAEDIKHFLKDAKSVTIQSANIKEATKEAVEKSGILADKPQKVQKCIINITADANITLSDISTIVETISSFYDCESTFSTLYDEYQKGFQVDTFLAKI